MSIGATKEANGIFLIPGAETKSLPGGYRKAKSVERRKGELWRYEREAQRSYKRGAKFDSQESNQANDFIFESNQANAFPFNGDL